MTSIDPNELWSTEQVARWLGVMPATLRKLRLEGRGPKFFQAVKKGTVRYRAGDVLAWINLNLHRSSMEVVSRLVKPVVESDKKTNEEGAR